MPKLHQISALILIFTFSATVSGQSYKAGANLLAEAGAILMVGKSLHRMTDTCGGLFPSQQKVYEGLYQASTVPRYLELFEFEVKWPLATGSRDEQLKSMGMSEVEAGNWCNAELVQELERFDQNYAHRYEEVEKSFAALKNAMAKQKSAKPRQPPAADPRFAGLVSRIVETSKLSFDSGNWALFADLYEAGTFDCWQSVPDAAGYGFLAMQPIPADATYTVKKFTGYMVGNGSFTNRTPTHLMEISYKQSRDGARCGLDERKRWPNHHFFLVQEGANFSLTHYCPRNASEMQWDKPVSAALFAKNLGRLDPGDWQLVPEDIKKDSFFARGAMKHLQQKYGFSHEEADIAIDHICDPANIPPQ